eukprot:CAMPEP_0172665628 /NCGR_PEP_ID=MMETSP1074-20121228/7366_1 /TAXON_ID=2916 /ORGANISM="Ceratium fusus, Strain PA161109" /LENGTH=181 /DNA_ID=CAMNT_0013481969 /DNA_START=759 /DNA_END=1305 /DNA_ORIENTATION=+
MSQLAAGELSRDTSHMRTAPSALPVSSCLPSGDQATAVTQPRCEERVATDPQRKGSVMLACHTRDSLSPLPVASLSPPGDHATAFERLSGINPSMASSGSHCTGRRVGSVQGASLTSSSGQLLAQGYQNRPLWATLALGLVAQATLLKQRFLVLAKAVNICPKDMCLLHVVVWCGGTLSDN